MKFDTSLVKVRGAVAEDLPFILNSWLKSYRNSSVSLSIPNQVYYPGHTNRVKEILSNPSTVSLILVNSTDADQIMGYVIFDLNAPVLHYLYVKQPFRKYGMGQFLVSLAITHHKSAILHCTHIAKKWKEKAKSFNLLFNPYVSGSSIDTSSNDASPVQEDRGGSTDPELV